MPYKYINMSVSLNWRTNFHKIILISQTSAVSECLTSSSMLVVVISCCRGATVACLRILCTVMWS